MSAIKLTQAGKLGSALLALAIMTVAWTQSNTLTAIGNQTACPGSTVTFTTTAGGPTPYTFTWKKNGVTISNQTTNHLTLSNVTAADSATYSVILKGGSNSVTNSATLTVSTGVTATPLPNLLRYVGSIAVFSTTPSGTGPFTYVWKKNGTTINGQTGSSLTLTNLTTANNGNYSVTVTGGCGNPVTVTGSLMVDTCFPAVDVMLVIDRSGSMTGKPYFDALAACSNFVQNLIYTNGDQAGLASYNSAATLDQTLTNKLSKLDQSIDAIPDATGFTSVSLGLQTGQGELVSVRHHTNSLPVLVLLSDGMPTGGDTASNALHWASQAKNAGTRIFTVGLGDVNAALLKGIASTTNDYYFTTNSAQLTALFNAISTVICRPPTNIVVSGLSSLTVCAGSIANFGVTATGCDSYRYQWLKGGVVLSGKTNSVLTLNNVTAADQGIYSVAVLSGCQNVTNSATLTVNANTLVTVPPANATNCPGSPASFHVSATGTGLAYQWYKGAGALSGATNSTLTLNSVGASDAGIYNVVISGTCGAPVTNSATLVVNSNAVVVTPPANVTVCPGATANFSVNATGTGLTYQWYKGTTLLSGKTGGTLTLNGVTGADAGTYNVIVSGTCGNAVTNGATLFVNANTVISTAPSNATNCPGTTANFSVNATGTGLTYQWYKGASLLGSQAGATLTLNNVSATDAGSYSVVVSGTCGNSVTNSGTLFVNANVVVSTAPSNTTNCPGTTANFAVNANGAGLTYQWYKGASLLGGKTASMLALNNVVATDAGVYSVVVSGTCGTPVTNSATLVVNANVLVTLPLADATVCPGSTANFNVNATGTGLNYQWYKGASLLGGQITSALTLNNVSATDAGTYSVVISGVCSASVTNSATLTVNSNVVVSVPPADSTNCPGTTATFAVNATGSGLTYQWYNHGSATNFGFIMPDGTSNILVVTNVDGSSVGTYRVIVSGACGNSVTNSASLFVNTLATISQSLTNLVVCPGSTANFSVNASGTALTYQWYKGANLLPAQTTNVLTLNNVNATDAGTYSVIVTGVCASPITNSATLTVNDVTAVVTAPLNSVNCPGTTANFSVNATGTGLSYQWYKGASLLSGQVTNILTLPNVGATDVGIYSVVVKGTCGLAITNSATLAVNTNVLISVPPANSTNCPGTTANFSVNALGSGVTYQWYKGANLLGGQTTSGLSLNNVSATDAGIYSVVVNGICGTPVTNSATLVVNTNASVVTAPTDLTVCPGTTANFSVTATGTGLNYQWYKGASLLSGQTTSALSLPNVSSTDAGTYSVVVKGVCSASITNSATLTVNSNLVIAVPPSNSTNCPGTTATFAVNATGSGLNYQWYHQGSATNFGFIIPGATNNILVVSNVTGASVGTYRVIMSGTCGNAVTNSASLVVNTVATISKSPTNVVVCFGSTANFSVNASGTALTYQWYQGTKVLNGQTTNVLTLNNVKASDAGTYSVVVTGVCGSPITNSATLTVNDVTAVVSPLNDSVNCPGTTANFSVSATGTGLTYQWYKGANLLNGQTANGLTLNNVSVADAGIYTVVVKGACGLAITNSASLTVNTNVLITAPPVNSTNCPGTTANFAVTATGTDLNYQWYKGTATLNGEKKNVLTLNNVSTTDAGTYSVVVTGACGNPVTNSATLTINPNTFVTVPPANSTNCPGTTANFSVSPRGFGLTFQWYKGATLLLGKTSSVLTLNSVSAADAGVYNVVTTGTCGAPITNSATLVVNQNVSVAAIAGVTNNIGTSVTFTAVPSGTGPFSYQWLRGASALIGQTNSTLTLNNLQPTDSGSYAVIVTGACGSAATTAAALTINLPPVVTIIYPTNGTIFVDPATFTVLASASDPDGVVTNVEFFSSTNGVDFVLLAETNNTPYLTIESNLPAGHYTFVARATDNLGATGNSTPVSVTVVPVQPPEVTLVGNLTLNTQDGYQWLTNVVCNPLYSHANALRIDIHNITNSAIKVVNASGTNNGVPFIISSGAIMAGDCWTNVIKFYDPLQLAFYPVLTVQLVDPIGVGEPEGTPQPIFSGKFLRDGTFLVEFTTVPGATYYIQYSSDMDHWKTAYPPMAGTGQHTQWIDSGPPATESLPSTKIQRFYRVLKTN